MKEVVILIPDIDKEQNVEIEVRINGRNNGLTYRVEFLAYEDIEGQKDERATVLKRKIEEYDRNWELVEIGAPDGSNIPLMFRKKGGEKLLHPAADQA